MSNVVKFPYSASRRVHSQKPRRSKNGTRKTAQAVTTRARAQVRTNEPVGSRRRVFLATSGTLAAFVGCDASGGTGKPAVAYEAARSHARAAFYALDYPALRRDIVRIVSTLHDG
jgi:hypothetical protein